MISRQDYFRGRDKVYAGEFLPEFEASAAGLIEKMRRLLSELQISTVHVTSGWRPPSINGVTKGAARKSHHQTGHAIDIADPRGEIGRTLLERPELLEKHGLYLEHPRADRDGHIHLQDIAPASGRRIFYP